MRYILIAVLGLAFAWMGYGPASTFGAMILLAIGFLMGDMEKQSEQLTVAFGGHSEPLSALIEDGYSELTASVEVLRRELGTVTKQLHVVTGELRAVRASLAAKPKGPWES